MMDRLDQFDFDNIGDQLPRRRQGLISMLARYLLKLLGWQILGKLPNVPQAVLVGAPHTSNYDGLPAILMVLATGLDIKVLGKKQLFAVPVLASFLRWAGVVAIDRDKKGSVLQANIDRFASGQPLLLGLAPEGTRGYTDTWHTGFYYLALKAGVPIVPVALDYKTKQIRFMPEFYPGGDYESDLPKILQVYRGAVGRHPQKMSKILQDLDA